MPERGKPDRGILGIVDTESLVPENPLLRKIDAAWTLTGFTRRTLSPVQRSAGALDVLFQTADDFFFKAGNIRL